MKPVAVEEWLKAMKAAGDWQILLAKPPGESYNLDAKFALCPNFQGEPKSALDLCAPTETALFPESYK